MWAGQQMSLPCGQHGRGTALPARQPRHHLTVLAGRPSKAATAAGGQDAAAKPKRKASSTPKKRGPKPTTSGDAVQLLDPEVLEEFRAKAAAEEAARAAAPTDPEEDPARFNFHRVLMNAASRGLPDLAESEVAQMKEAGLPPGPRAYHALAFAYVRAKLPYEALDVAKRAVEEGLLLLPETFVVLIFALLNYADRPDAAAAQEVLASMEAQFEAQPPPAQGPPVAQQGWLMLCKELFRKELISEAMTTVKRGYDAKGYVSDPQLAAFVIEQLARAGLKERAYQELESLESQGHRPGPEHYNPIIKAEAALGSWRRARYMLTDAFQKPTYYPPTAESFTALLEGMVLSVDPATGLPSGPGVDTDEGMRLSDVQQARQEEQEQDAGAASTRSLAAQFKRLREEMLLYGLRPTPAAYAAMCSGHIKTRAMDEALGTFQAMIDAGGTTRLLPKKKLTGLLLTLAEEDRPADLLNVLKALVANNQPLPKSANTVLDNITPGTTLAAAWLPAHFEHMRTHQDDGSGMGAASVGTEALRSMLSQARQSEEFDGVPLSVLGGCVVADDGSGVWIKPSKMTLEQLRAELTHADIEFPETAKRTALAKLVKERREDLPRQILDVQAHMEATQKAAAEALARKTGISLVEAAKTKKGSKELKTYRVVEMADGKVEKIQNVVQEVAKRKIGFTVERGGSDPYGADDALSTERDGDMDDADELADILKDGVDESTADILRDEDSTTGEAMDAGLTEGAGLGDTAGLEYTIDYIEARAMNKTAGMKMAFEVLRCVELLGGTPSGPDYEALVAGAIAENNADVALELSERLPRLLGMGYSRDSVLALFEQLARVCLNSLKAAYADLVLERAEDQGMEPDPALYAMLSKALGDRPRHRELAEKEIQDLVEDNVNADLLLGEDDSSVLSDEGEGAGGSAEDKAGSGKASGNTPLVAEEDDELDDDEAGVYGRIPAAEPSRRGQGEEEGNVVQTEEAPAWETDKTRGAIQGPAYVPVAVRMLSDMGDDLVPTELLPVIETAINAELSGGTATQLLPAPSDSSGQQQGEGEEGAAGYEVQADGSYLLADGRIISPEHLDVVVRALGGDAGAKTEVDSLVQSGDLDGSLVEDWTQQLTEYMDSLSQQMQETVDKEDDTVLKGIIPDIEELLFSPDMQQLLEEAEEKLGHLDAQVSEAESRGDHSQAEALRAVSSEIQSQVQAAVQPRMTEFLNRGLSDERVAQWERELDAVLNNDDLYRVAARDWFQSRITASGLPVTDELMRMYDQSPTLEGLTAEDEEGVAEFLQSLAELPDAESVNAALTELTWEGLTQAGIPVAEDGGAEESGPLDAGSVEQESGTRKRRPRKTATPA